MKNIALVLALLSFFAVDTYAQSSVKTRPVAGKGQKRRVSEWQLITSEDDDTAISYNTRLFTRVDKETIHVWIKEKPLTDKARLEEINRLADLLETVEPPVERSSTFEMFKKYSYSLRLQEYNCVKLQLRTSESYVYDRDGKSIFSMGTGVQSSEWTPWINVIPNSIGELILDAVCHK